MTPEEAERPWSVPNATWFFERLGRIPEPLRLPDLPGYLGSQRLADSGLPVPAGPFLAAPVRHPSRSAASVYPRKATRIVASLRHTDQSLEQLLRVLTFRRSDGREVSLEEFSLAKALSTGETVRSEEIILRVPEGRSVTALLNAPPSPRRMGG